MELDQIDLAKDLALKCKHHELYLQIMIENIGSTSLKLSVEDEDKTKNFNDAIEYIKSKVEEKEQQKFIKQFGQTLAKYHPEKILEMIIGFIKEDIKKIDKNGKWDYYACIFY